MLKHNKFIHDTDELVNNIIANPENGKNICEEYKLKWNNIFKLKKEKTIDNELKKKKKLINYIFL